MPDAFVAGAIENGGDRRWRRRRQGPDDRVARNE